MRALLRRGILALAAAASAASGQGPAPKAASAEPVVVELFTSEGCSSCPPADRILARLAREQPVRGARVIALGEHVDYWDELGWRDAFSSPVFTERQRAYARSLDLASLYTPQMVIDGRFQALGGDEEAVVRAIETAARMRKGDLALRLVSKPAGPRGVEITARWDPALPAQVLVALTEDGVTSRVTRGENAGRVLEHAAVVRQVLVAGSGRGAFTGRVSLVARPPSNGAWIVALVQDDRGRVLAAGALEDRAHPPVQGPGGNAPPPDLTGR